MLTRREFAAGVVALAASSAMTPAALAARRLLGKAPPPSSQLLLTPPALSSPTTHIIPATGANLSLAAGDHIIQLPNVAVSSPNSATNTTILIIDGKGVANNIVLNGGKIQAPLCYNPATMQLSQDGTYALYSTVGFTGATGGTFMVNCNQNATVVTAPIAYNASAATILAAINTALGHSDACFGVFGSGTGGPWQIVPGNNGATGRCSVNISGLTGSPTLTTPAYVFNATISHLLVKDFLGTLHIEGLHVDGSLGSDATAIQSPYETCSVQYANCHLTTQFEPFHNDWNHPDGTQAYLGPPKFFAQNCDFITKGGNGFIGQPRHTSSPAALQALWDWWFLNVQFRGYDDSDQTYPQAADGGLSAGGGCYIETDYPTTGANGANWTWQMQNCYANKFSSTTGALAPGRPIQEIVAWYLTQPTTHYGIPAGLSTNAVPPSGFMCDPAKGQCGIGYVSPGYVGLAQPIVTKRLEGTTQLT